MLLVTRRTEYTPGLIDSSEAWPLASIAPATVYSADVPASFMSSSNRFSPDSTLNFTGAVPSSHLPARRRPWKIQRAVLTAPASPPQTLLPACSREERHRMLSVASTLA